MPNVTSPDRPPRYRRHKATGRAVVTLDGRDIYLGKHMCLVHRIFGGEPNCFTQ